MTLLHNDRGLRPAWRMTRAAAVSALCLGALACQDLNVENTNNPDVQDIYRDPVNLQSAIGTSYRTFWGVAQGDRTNGTAPVVGIAALSDELVTISTTSQAFQVAQEPRVPYDNLDAGGWLNRKPYYDLYEAIATNVDGIRALQGGVVLGTVTPAYPEGTVTNQALIFARMMNGLSHLYLGLLFDQAIPFDETTDLDSDLEFAPYEEIVDFGIAQLEAAIARSEADTRVDTLPADWINGMVVPRTTLVRYMHSMIARGLAGAARNPAERAAVDWAKVKFHAERGVTAPFGQLADPSISGTSSNYVRYIGFSGTARISNRLIGPADTTGRYQAWLTAPLATRNAIEIATPDRRIHGAASATTPGMYFQRLPTQGMGTTQGTYMLSNYRSIRFPLTHWNTGFIQTTNPDEMRFLIAEAEYRLGNRARAAELINVTRVANGKLPPVTVTGPPNTASCVPRKASGACGDLFDALMYEKRIEMHAIEAIVAYIDARGWGTLVPGTMIHFPVTGRELQTLGLPVYTFGGVGNPGSAP